MHGDRDGRGPCPPFCRWKERGNRHSYTFQGCPVLSLGRQRQKSPHWAPQATTVHADLPHLWASLLLLAALRATMFSTANSSLPCATTPSMPQTAAAPIQLGWQALQVTVPGALSHRRHGPPRPTARKTRATGSALPLLVPTVRRFLSPAAPCPRRVWTTTKHCSCEPTATPVPPRNWVSPAGHYHTGISESAAGSPAQAGFTAP